MNIISGVSLVNHSLNASRITGLIEQFFSYRVIHSWFGIEIAYREEELLIFNMRITRGNFAMLVVTTLALGNIASMPLAIFVVV